MNRFLCSLSLLLWACLAQPSFARDGNAPLSAYDIGDKALYPKPGPVSQVTRQAQIRTYPSLSPLVSSQPLQSMQNKAVKLELLALTRSDEIGGQAVPDDQEAIILTTRWTNLIPKANVAKSQLEGKADRTNGAGSLFSGGSSGNEKMVEVDVAFKVSAARRHLTLAADGLAYEAQLSSQSLPQGMPLEQDFVLPRHGESKNARLAFVVPKGSRHLALQFIDNLHGSLDVPLEGEAAKAKQPPVSLGKTVQIAGVELTVGGLSYISSYLDKAAPDGWHYLQLSLLGRGRGGADSALARLDPTRILWLNGDEGRLFMALPSEDGEPTLSFTPAVFQQRQVSFLLPESLDRFTLGIRGDNRTTVLPVTAQPPLSLPPSPLSGRDGNSLTVSVFGLRFDKQQLILDLAVVSHLPDKGLELILQDQFRLSGEQQGKVDLNVTRGLSSRPPQPLVVPPASAVRFELAFGLPAGQMPQYLWFGGFEQELKLDLGSLKVKGAYGQADNNGKTVFPEFSSRPAPVSVEPATVAVRTTTPDTQAATPPEPKPYRPSPPVALPAFDPGEVPTEKEPNDSVKEAEALGSSHMVRGTLSDKDMDVFYLDVQGNPQKWLLEVQGSGVGGNVAYIDASGVAQLQRRPNAGVDVVWLENLYLMPGRHWFSVQSSGREGEYVLRVVPLGVPAPGDELEPNDDISRAHSLTFGTERSGLIAFASDEDHYSFSLEMPSHVRLTLLPPEDLRLDLRIEGNGSGIARAGDYLGEAGKPVRYQAWLEAGDYQVKVYSGRRESSQSAYRLRLDLLDPFDLADDREPNDSAGSAAPLPFGKQMQGLVGDFGDTDWFFLPPLEQPTRLTLTVQSDKRRIGAALKQIEGQEVRSVSMNSDVTKRTDHSDTYHASLEAGKRYVVNLMGQGRYTLGASFDTTLTAAPDIGGPTLALVGEVPVFSAYRNSQQQVDLLARISAGEQDLYGLSLQSAVSQAGWSVSLPEGPISLKKGQSLDVPLTLTGTPDRPDGPPATLFLHASNNDHKGSTLAVPLAAQCDAFPLSETSYQPVPKSLRGGINLARSGIGAQPPPNDSTLAQLFDGMVASGGEWSASSGQLPYEIQVQLAGDGTTPLAGVALIPQVGYGNQDQLGPFSVLISDDGSQFTQVYEGQLSPRSEEQYFPFPTPVRARFVRLRLGARDAGSPSARLSLAEVKVIAAADVRPFGQQGINLADPNWGGHVVRALPQAYGYGNLEAMLTDKEDADILPYRKGDVAPVEWVIGFHHNRAARLQGFSWREQSKPLPRGIRAIEDIEVSVSLTGPLGPWQSLGRWPVPSEPGQQASIEFEEPVWARFVKFHRNGHSDESYGWRLPETLRILEKPADGSYQSIVGEWGLYRQEAAYEQLHPMSAVAGIQDLAGDSQKTALALTPGRPLDERVSLGRDRDMFSLQIPADQNQLSLTFTGEDVSRLAVSLSDESGLRVTLTDQYDAMGNRRFDATVVGGHRYFVQVEEPPRSIMIAWDNSSSVARFHPLMYRSLQRFFDEVKPQQEWVNLIPFRDRGAAPLLANWSDDPQVLKQALNSYNRADGSSNAENTLTAALSAFTGRPGNRAMVVLTDAASDGFGRSRDLWAGFDKMRPAVFPLELHLRARGIEHFQNLMQDWAAVNRGRYAAFRTLADLDRAFARASCLMRRPVSYRLQADSSRVEPGSLILEWQPDKAAAGAVVELIVDASGSMRSKKALLDGKLKIEVAKDVLHQVINSFPDQLDVGLRLYGHRVREGQPGDCQDSELVLPIAPFDADALRSRIDAIQALGTTSISYSLQQAGLDLEKTSGRKLILLVTDGEEECQGNPAEAITALRDKGLDVRLDIAGFALPNEKTKQDMRLAAAAGGGEFFDAKDKDSLISAIRQSLAATYEILDAQGLVVGKGLVGDPALVLAPGYYQVKVSSARADASFPVVIEKGSRQVLTLQSDGEVIRQIGATGTSGQLTPGVQ
ncbi:VWA domain-containing protein [Bowmanella dokdonensis]|uniref:VWA domain-containing protein n=1 Tax=Bowmanella dokdonensis TaxID=751969 RepID=A0A939IQJ5_9ALTE|nr:VWA domain-containing protein [Bowmanella dokdonensis]MBN7825104.1 VWA domain-containing protein [Bowmanella dokdonensis]